MRGQIGWVEVYSENSEESAAFYERAFGWNIQRDPSMGDYIMFTDTGGLGGGFTKGAPKLAGAIYILTESIESSLDDVMAAGGETVQQRTPISGDVGSWASFSDPSGNVVGLFEQAARR